MNRLPSISQLEAMSPSNRSEILSVFAEQARKEIEGLKSGCIWTTNGKTVRGEIRNSRKRLARVYEAANRFGDYVGQSEQTQGAI